jgi:Na+-transporting NADH:ubiquinone oxidoreductase subunit A
MALHVIRKGLDLPIEGQPAQQIDAGRAVTRVAVLADDYIGMKPRMEVAPGDEVRRGSLLFEDFKRPGVMHTSPAAGKVVAVHRGDKRALRSVVIELNERERAGEPSADDFAPFRSFVGGRPASLSREQVKALVVESGAWTALRQRPFGRVPALDATPSSLFVTAIDTHPLAPAVDVALDGQAEAFEVGLEALVQLVDGPVHLCRAPGSAVSAGEVEGVTLQEFQGPHPAGLPGTHIHFVDPVSREKAAWHINYADVVLIGQLFLTGRLHVDRVVSVAGPGVRKPRLVRTRLGASLDELVAGELVDGEVRVVSGSLLGGRAAKGEVEGFLGRYALQVSALREGREREFLGWLEPGEHKFSVFPVFAAGLLEKLLGRHTFSFTTTTNGSHRAMVPIGMYEDVMPLDILPTFLLRSMATGDLEKAEQLGALELDEEDLALCTMVCPGKNDYGKMLRDTLDTIEREG